MEMDGMTAFKRIQTKDGMAHRNSHFVHAVRAYMHREWEVKLLHIYREANFVADYLAVCEKVRCRVS